MIIKKNKKIIHSEKSAKCDYFSDKNQDWHYNGYNKVYGVSYRVMDERVSSSEERVTNYSNITGTDLEDV